MSPMNTWLLLTALGYNLRPCYDLSLRYIISRLDVIEKEWLMFLTLAALTFLVAWKLAELHYGREIRVLKEHVAMLKDCTPTVKPSAKAPPSDARREEIVREFMASCAGDPRGFLDWLLNHRDVLGPAVTEACERFHLNDGAFGTARDLGLISQRSEPRAYGWGHDTRMTYFFSVSAHFSRPSDE